jgi:uncharacterized membrane protein
MKQPKITDTGIERMVSVLLRTGVLVSGLVVLAGGVYYLTENGAEAADYHIFHGQPSINRIVPQIVEGAIALRPESIIQLGILILIATPIMRVAFSLAGFAMERDRAYVAITAIVLLILLYSLISGALGG